MTKNHLQQILGHIRVLLYVRVKCTHYTCGTTPTSTVGMTYDSELVQSGWV